MHYMWLTHILVLHAGEQFSAQKLTKLTKRVITRSHHVALKKNAKTAAHSSSFNEKHVPICAINPEDKDMDFKALFSKKND